MSCTYNSNREDVASISICVSPISSMGCVEINRSGVFYSSEKELIDTLQNFESIKYIQLQKISFKILQKLFYQVML